MTPRLRQPQPHRPHPGLANLTRRCRLGVIGAVPCLQGVERQAVRLEVILLCVVHRDEQMLRPESRRDDGEAHEGEQAPRPVR